jgi:hypothetical protein
MPAMKIGQISATSGKIFFMLETGLEKEPRKTTDLAAPLAKREWTKRFAVAARYSTPPLQVATLQHHMAVCNER